MSPTSTQRRAAESLKAEGNALFTKGKYSAAAECYTEAITLDPSLAVLYVNRGMCYKKLCKWQQVAQDATTALSHNRDLMKAHYLLGVARRELRDVQQAITHLSKALEAAREQGDSIKDEIWRELAKAKYAAWQQDSKQRSAQAEAVKQQLDSLLRSQWLQGCVANATGNTAGMNGSKDGLEQEQQDLQEQLQAVLQVRVLAALPAWRNQPAATAGVELASCSACVHARPQIAHPVRSFVTV
eukprot:GHUV01034560.1.p1 GENE.GHUV01034560.1~~GHUV01034560.1.p1  ORF type:complete len:242 (+),score=78.89 GHUV01034560.1:274-999(+)